MALKVTDEAKAAIANLRDPSTDTDFLLLWYGDTKQQLLVKEQGTGGMDALVALLTEEEIFYGMVKVKGGNEKDKLAVRFASVSWCGHAVSPMKRSKVLNHKEAVTTAFGHCHVTFQPKEISELSQAELMKTIQLTAGTNYHAGLRNMEKDEKGNYKTADGEHVTASGAKAKYDANAEKAKAITTKTGETIPGDTKPASLRASTSDSKPAADEHPCIDVFECEMPPPPEPEPEPELEPEPVAEPVAEPEPVEEAASAAALKNKAFLFIKPHAVTEKTKELAKEALVSKGLTILSEGELSAAEIDEKKLIDNHYYAIASKATILKPNELNIPEDKFKDKFGLEWSEALAGGRVFNALDACADLEIDAAEMDRQWGIHKKADKLIKFGGGFYCGHLEIEGKEPCYVFNGFFMAMRSKYVAPGCSIYYYVVEWDAAAMSWEQFRSEALGPTDPTEAPADSVRGMIYAKWEELGLASQPDVGDNGMHGSASPFEALAEVCNWVGAEVDKEDFGSALLSADITAETIKAWSVDPQVNLPSGDKGSLFDAVEDTNADACLAKLVELKSCN